jgi:hypothetical protein
MKSGGYTMVLKSFKDNTFHVHLPYQGIYFNLDLTVVANRDSLEKNLTQVDRDAEDVISNEPHHFLKEECAAVWFVHRYLNFIEDNNNDFAQGMMRLNADYIRHKTGKNALVILSEDLRGKLNFVFSSSKNAKKHLRRL